MEKLNTNDVMKSFRIRIGKSQKEMATLLGITRLTFRLYEQNPGKMPIKIYGRLVELYGDDFNDYFFAKKLYKM